MSDLKRKTSEKPHQKWHSGAVSAEDEIFCKKGSHTGYYMTNQWNGVDVGIISDNQIRGRSRIFKQHTEEGE
jgi:hypothetical protein